MIRSWANQIDYKDHQIKILDGNILNWDHLIICPGLHFFTPKSLQPLSGEAIYKMPHAFSSNDQIPILAHKIKHLPQGGTFAIVVVDEASTKNNNLKRRYPLAIYERTCLIAHWLQQHNPASKLLLLDHQDHYPHQSYFDRIFEQFGGLIEWIPKNVLGALKNIDTNNQVLYFNDYGQISADLINLILPQKAGWVAEKNSLTNQNGFCPVSFFNMESTIEPNVYILGDAIDGGEVKKSANSAIQQAQILIQYLSQFHDLTPHEISQDPLQTSWLRTSHNNAIKIQHEQILLPDSSDYRVSKTQLTAPKDDREALVFFEQSSKWFNHFANQCFQLKT
ncbi:MAG: hypothetical protein AAF403_09150, partial [Pseudomonadota bacterium]